MSACLSLLSSVVLAHLDIYSPESIVGNWADVPARHGPPEYTVNGEVALAQTCPCEWLQENEPSSPALKGHLLLLTDGVCQPACTAALAACAANRHNASGMLMSIAFNSPAPPLPPLAPAPPPPTAENVAQVDVERDALQTLADLSGCSSAVPTSYISRNMSAAMADSVVWNATLLPTVIAGAPVSRRSEAVGVVADAVAINVTIYRDPDNAPRDCTRVRRVCIYARSSSLLPSLPPPLHAQPSTLASKDDTILSLNSSHDAPYCGAHDADEKQN